MAFQFWPGEQDQPGVPYAGIVTALPQACQDEVVNLWLPRCSRQVCPAALAFPLSLRIKAAP